MLSSAGISATFKIRQAKQFVPIVTLSTKDNVKLAKQLSNVTRDVEDVNTHEKLRF